MAESLLSKTKRLHGGEYDAADNSTPSLDRLTMIGEEAESEWKNTTLGCIDDEEDRE